MHVGRDHGAPEDLGPTTRAPQHLTEVICRRRESWHHRCTMCIDRCAIRKVANKYWSDYLDAEGVSGPLDVTMRSHLPAPVEKMAVRAGARMRPFFSDDDTIGYYKRVEREIGVAVELGGEGRRLFTIAHEIGHHALHWNTDVVMFRESHGRGTGFRRRDTLANIRDTVEAHREREANCFAAELLVDFRLVPIDFVRRFHGRVSCAELQDQDDRLHHLTHGNGITVEAVRRIVRECAESGEPRRAAALFSACNASFAAKALTPLHKIYGVSKGMMAIRLVELGLVC